MKIPLEDNWRDILEKALRGHGETLEHLAQLAGLDSSAGHSLLDDPPDRPSLSSAARALGLDPVKFDRIVAGRYVPAEIPVVEGLFQSVSYFGEMLVNAYLLWVPGGGQAALFDTGADADPILSRLDAQSLHLDSIFLTHAHTDHIYELDRLLEKTGASAWISEREPVSGVRSFPDRQSFCIEGLRISTLPTGGHSPGGTIYLVEGLAVPVAIVGDALFAGSVGGIRTGYRESLKQISGALLTLPDETIICPGHGPMSTIGEQKKFNPFF